MTNLCAALWALVGKRSDDPAVLGFHESHRMPPPPPVMTTKIAYDVKVPDGQASIHYGAELRRLDTWPPHRIRGRFIGYVTSVQLRADFAGPLLDALSTKMTMKEAETRAIQTDSTPIYRIFTLFQEDGRKLQFVYDSDEGTLDEIRLVPEELDEDDARLAAREAEVRASEPARVRTIPKRVRAPFPAPLAKLGEIGSEEGFGDVDLEIHDDWELGGPKAWTGSAAAEEEFAVFGQDGSGGMVAFWLVNDAPITEQPIVLLGSEGEVGAVAKDLADFLYLLGSGVGPYEAVEYGSTKGEHDLPSVLKLAAEVAPRVGRTPEEVLATAIDTYGDVEERVRSLVG
ncbi:hypothetical protein AKJ09_07029 [Labilithrix luteola]|uniref:Uncharacterized protein n=1 Tax=Labilithrix luteola TaxID=1391654 RepID=A0A0K1Q3E1_9BACT|nr:hypothetical protein [Labilithrix luteola]AKV00366.1 hypothetical protein AKJ09_07029 [Labilithrix luteola]